MLGRLLDGGRPAELAPRIEEIDGVHQFAALVALVTAGVVVAAERARPLHETIRQEAKRRNNQHQLVSTPIIPSDGRGNKFFQGSIQRSYDRKRTRGGGEGSYLHLARFAE